MVAEQHVKPNVRVQGKGTQPLDDAIKVTSDSIGLTKEDYILIDDQVRISQ